MTVYGRLSRLTENKHPRIYPPVITPTAAQEQDPERSDRWCWTGRHRVAEPERWDGDKGCSHHPTTQGRKQRGSSQSRYCAVCKKARARTAFSRGYVRGEVSVCDSCGVSEVAA